MGADVSEQLLEGLAVGVDEGVVGHDGVGWLAAEFGVEAHGAGEAVVVGGGVFVVVDLGVGDPGVVVDNDVDVVPADAAAAVGTVRGDSVAGLGEAGESFDVHVQERAWT